MNRLYLIPDRADMARQRALTDRYGCAFEYNDFFSPQVLSDPKKQEEIIAYYKGLGRDFSQDTIHGAFLDVTIHSGDPLIRDASMLRVRQSMEIAERMGVRGVVFHTGRLGRFRSPGYLKNWQDCNAAFFTEMAEQFPRRQIFMENMFDEAPDVLAGLAERMKPVENFGVCLDYAHAVISGCPGREWVKALHPYIRHMHINDNDLTNDQHRPVGSGRIDWEEFNGLIREYDVCASALVEVNGCAAQEESLKFMRKNGIYPMEKGAV